MQKVHFHSFFIDMQCTCVWLTHAWKCTWCCVSLHWRKRHVVHDVLFSFSFFVVVIDGWHFKLQIHIQVSVTLIRINGSIIGFHWKWKWLMIANCIRPPTHWLKFNRTNLFGARVCSKHKHEFINWNVLQSYWILSWAKAKPTNRVEWKQILCVWIDNKHNFRIETPI